MVVQLEQLEQEVQVPYLMHLRSLLYPFDAAIEYLVAPGLSLLYFWWPL